MITLVPVLDSYCQGVAVSTTDLNKLADALALLLAQEFTLAKQLMGALPAGVAATSRDRVEIEDIISRRLNPTDVYHRDGLLFQLIMWLAAHVDLESTDLVALPHSQATAKGQDSLIVHRTAGGVVALSICEDKATENPRDTVRDAVWPEIAVYEAGGRRDELRSGLIATLGTGGVGSAEAEQLVKSISWKRSLRYRVRLTLEQPRSTKLFDGFEKTVAGGAERRRGETLLLATGVRRWMADFAALIEARLRAFAESSDDV